MGFTTSFDEAIAKKAGVEEAILHKWVIDQCTLNRAMGDEMNLFEDQWWVRCPQDMFKTVFTFWTPSQVGRILSNLTTKGLLKQRQGQDKSEIFLLALENVDEVKPKKKAAPVVPANKEDDIIEYLRTQPDGSKLAVRVTRTKLIAELIHEFRHVNPAGVSAFYSRPVYREAMNAMIGAYQVDLLFRLLAVIPKTNGMQYAPTITNPLEFQRLVPKLVAFIQKKQNEGQTGFTVSL